MKRIPLSSLWSLTKGRRLVLGLLLVILIISASLESLGIATLYPVVDMLQDAEKMEFYRQKVISALPFLVDHLNTKQMIPVTLIVVGFLFLVKNIIFVLAYYGNVRSITHLYLSWMKRIFKTYLAKPYQFFVEHQAGDLVQRQLLQTKAASAGLRDLLDIMRNSITFIAIYIVIWLISAKAILILTIIMIPVALIVLMISRGRVYRIGGRIVELEKKGYALSTEIISGMRQVKTFCVEDHFLRRYSNVWNEFGRNKIRNMLLATLPRPMLEVLVVIGCLGAVYVSIISTGNGAVAIPLFAVLGVALIRVLPLVGTISSSTMNLASTLPAAQIVSRLLVADIPKINKSNLILFQHEMMFKNVSFSYNENDFVLKNLNLRFKQNHFYGIVGPSGCGKSTLVDLLTGFYLPQKGSIFIDGINLKEINIRSWLQKIGVISQETFIFNGTIEDNICFGVDEKERDMERMIEVAHISDAQEFIEMLHEGYKTFVGERGFKLSGGQRQRLAIARALYRNPLVLIFDEATSSLDPHSERRVQKAIESLSGTRTLIVIAHRLSTIVKADHIYVINNGELVEEGKHKDLQAKKGLYNRLCKSQKID